MKTKKMTRNLILAAVALIYWIVPIDLMPDIIPVLGQVDDVIIGVITVLNLLHGMNAERRLEERADSSGTVS